MLDVGGLILIKTPSLIYTEQTATTLQERRAYNIIVPQRECSEDAACSSARIGLTHLPGYVGVTSPIGHTT